MIKKIVTTALVSTALLIGASKMANAEIQYDHKNIEHIEDKKCIAVLSHIRDYMNTGVEVDGNTVWLRTVVPTEDLVEARNKLTDIQNQYILKYAYSKQLNTHVDAYKMYIEATDMEGFPELLVQCLVDKV